MSNNTLNLILASDRPVLFEKLLEKDDIDYKELLYYLLNNSSTKIAKNVDIVQSIYNLIEFKVKENNWAIQISSENGHAEVVRLLLADPNGGVDPSTGNNYSIRVASENGHAEVVKLLLADSRVNPGAFDSWAIREASGNGHTEVVKLLLADSLKRVDPSANDNEAIQEASSQGYTEIVKLLLKDGRADPSDEDNGAIQWASANGHTDVVKLLSLHIKQLKIDIEILDIIVNEWLVF